MIFKFLRKQYFVTDLCSLAGEVLVEILNDTGAFLYS